MPTATARLVKPDAADSRLLGVYGALRVVVRGTQLVATERARHPLR
jgi:hypothetical protein